MCVGGGSPKGGCLKCTHNNKVRGFSAAGAGLQAGVQARRACVRVWGGECVRRVQVGWRAPAPFVRSPGAGVAPPALIQAQPSLDHLPGLSVCSVCVWRAVQWYMHRLYITPHQRGWRHPASGVRRTAPRLLAARASYAKSLSSRWSHARPRRRQAPTHLVSPQLRSMHTYIHRTPLRQEHGGDGSRFAPMRLSDSSNAGRCV